VRLRILDAGADQFPEWWTAAAIRSGFNVVSTRPDAVVLPMPLHTWTSGDFERASDFAAAARVPTVVYDPFDSWDDPSRGWRGDQSWTADVQHYVLRATIVAGPQLPAEGGPAHPVPLPYPPVVRRVPAPPDLGSSTVDVHFAGVFRDEGWAAPPHDTRNRHYRGHLVATLQRALPDHRLAIRNVEYRSEPQEGRSRLRRQYVAELDRSTMVLAPAGFGYLTFRHSDAWARGRVLLSEPVQRHIAVPEPQRWQSGEVAVLYDPLRDDIADVVAKSLKCRKGLADIARAGWEYGRRWTAPEAQVAALVHAISEHG